MRISKDLLALEADIRHAPTTERQFTMRMELRLEQKSPKVKDVMKKSLVSFGFFFNFTFHKNLPDIWPPAIPTGLQNPWYWLRATTGESGCDLPSTGCAWLSRCGWKTLQWSKQEMQKTRDIRKHSRNPSSRSNHWQFKWLYWKQLFLVKPIVERSKNSDTQNAQIIKGINLPRQHIL